MSVWERDGGRCANNMGRRGRGAPTFLAELVVGVVDVDGRDLATLVLEPDDDLVATRLLL